MWFRRKSKASPVRERFGEEVARRLEADPGVERRPIENARIYTRPGFLSVRQCTELVRMIDANRRPSTLMSASGRSEFRTSESCDMDRWSPAVQPIDESIAAQLGIPPAHGETMQGQRYAPGQHFRAHHDYFQEGQFYWDEMQATGGQRTWTAMIYLNDVAEGGATWFPHAGIRIAPKAGLLLAWNNMKPDGSPNAHTLHEGMPVIAGTKYIVTKWFRERPWIGRPGGT